MEIYLPTARQYEGGEIVIIEHINGEYDTSLLIGRVEPVDTEARIIETPFPLDPHKDMWEFVYGEASTQCEYNEKAWMAKFKASNYDKYMRVDIKESGEVETAGR